MRRWLMVVGGGLLVGSAVLWWPIVLDSNPEPEASRMPPPAAEDPANPGILIEGGRFTRRSRTAEADTVFFRPRSTEDESSFYPLVVAPFWIQQHEVTNAEFRRWDPNHAFPDGQGRHPVANVTWEEAMQYAASLGGRLPTEAEWQFAAGGAEGRAYPWGDGGPTCERAQFGDCEPVGTIEVMRRPSGATPEGIHDMAGNVWEWVMPNWFEPEVTPVNEASRRMRGGSFNDDAFFIRTRNRNNDFPEGFRHAGVGFRVVWPDTRRD